jgi:sterol desaturase/sphingolipid hydroxylase (fatty acid hydroxylase superfamily)
VNVSPIVLSIPVFFILIGVELLVARFTHKELYRFPDAVANLGCGITSQLSGLFFRILAIGVYEILFDNFSLFAWDRTVAYWVTLVLLADLAYYWAHRMSHEINLFWGGHVVHHQSEDYNLSVALRQSSFQVIWTFAFSLPLAFLGFRTFDFALVSSFITLYQFWIHTEMIGKLGPLEWFFNTPSHHRVHHGRDPKYIDKNHAGTFIIWDRMFGTFQEEEEKPTYGITKPLNSWNAVWANFSHYAAMAAELRIIRGWPDKIRYLFNKPGWLPSSLGGYRAAPPVDKDHYKKYETHPDQALTYYVLFQFGVTVACTAWFLFRQGDFTLWEKSLGTALISLAVVNAGVLMENRSWAWISEWGRIVVCPVLVLAAWLYFDLSILSLLLAGVFAAVSLPWYYFVFRARRIA